MQLEKIDKAQYRKRLNIIIVGFIASLLVLSLAFGSILIALFSNVTVIDTQAIQAAGDAINEATAVEQPSNFRYNLAGVVLALLANVIILHRIKTSEFFKEVYYVWQVKQIQNLIYRKLKIIKSAGKAGNEKALIILSFYYESQLQVYQLDDNTITLSTIEKHHQEVKDWISEHNLVISASQFEKELIKPFTSTSAL